MMYMLLEVFEKTMASSKYGIQMVSRRCPKQFSINLWKLAGAFVNPNGILTHSYNPQGVMKAVPVGD
jgi:hypothetical protein